jgi:hypothetical protein
MRTKLLRFFLLFFFGILSCEKANAGCKEFLQKLYQWALPQKKIASLISSRHNLFTRPVISNKRKVQRGVFYFRQKEVLIDQFPHEIIQKIKSASWHSAELQKNVSFIAVLDHSGDWHTSDDWQPGSSFADKLQSSVNRQKYSTLTEFSLNPASVFEFEFSNRSLEFPSWIAPRDIDYAIAAFKKYQSVGFNGKYHYFLTPNVFIQQRELVFSHRLQHYFERLENPEGMKVDRLFFRDLAFKPIYRRNPDPFVLGISMSAKQLEKSASGRYAYRLVLD